jgi:hypothetical protein
MRGTRPSAASYRHVAGLDSRALRERRGNPEDLSPGIPPRVILPLCHSERSEESLSPWRFFSGILRCAQNDTGGRNVWSRTQGLWRY